MSFDPIAFSTNNSKINQVASGFKKAEKISDETYRIHFIDGSHLDMKIPAPKVSTVLSADLIASTEIGSVTNGKKYDKGTLLEDIIRDILTTYNKPKITITLSPATSLYDAVDDAISTINITAKVSKGTLDISNVKFYVDNTLVNTVTTDVDAGGAFKYTYTPATPIKKSTTFKVTTEDEKSASASSSTSVTFIGKTYYGIVDPDVEAPTDTQIKSLGKTLKNSKGYVYDNIVCDFNKIVYAYPQSLGALTSIKDVVNNFNYTSSFTRTSVKIDGIDYYCYTLTEPTGADGVQLTFA